MAADHFENPEYAALVHQIEAIDTQIYDLGETRRHLLNKLDSWEA